MLLLSFLSPKDALLLSSGLVGGIGRNRSGNDSIRLFVGRGRRRLFGLFLHLLEALLAPLLKLAHGVEDLIDFVLGELERVDEAAATPDRQHAGLLHETQELVAGLPVYVLVVTLPREELSEMVVQAQGEEVAVLALKEEGAGAERVVHGPGVPLHPDSLLGIPDADLANELAPVSELLVAVQTVGLLCHVTFLSMILKRILARFFCTHYACRIRAFYGAQDYENIKRLK